MIVILALSILALATVVLYGWLLVRLGRWQDQVSARMDSLAVRLAAQPVAAGKPRLAANFVLSDLDGRAVALSALRARGKRILLNFTDPKCGPCYELLTDVGGWERVYGNRLTIVTISSGDPHQNRMLAQEYGLGTILLQHEHGIADAFGLQMIPAAVLIEPDGQIFDSATGAHAVRQLVASGLGLALPPQEMISVQPLRPGQSIGDLRRPDLEGNLIDLSDRLPMPTVLLFWSPGCSHCQDMLSAMREWDTEPDGPRMVVVTSGPVVLNREAGLHAPMIQDDEGVLKRIFGVQGTPAAVLIDGQGRVATEVARGVAGVRSLVDQRYGSPTAAD
jgi:thiol-disulfide isomerase/thioredoxin